MSCIFVFQNRLQKYKKYPNNQCSISENCWNRTEKVYFCPNKKSFQGYFDFVPPQKKRICQRSLAVCVRRAAIRSEIECKDTTFRKGAFSFVQFPNGCSGFFSLRTYFCLV